MERLSSLQALRAVAALGVLYEHLSAKNGGGGTFGAAGVDLFFVLSGYIVSKSAATRPEGFVRNRLIRVLPTYYIAAVGALIQASREGLEWQRLLATVTLWPAYAQVVHPYLVPAWSLCYEMVFYGALAAVITGVRPALLVAGFIVCWVLALTTPIATFDFLGSPIILEFLAGVALARMNVQPSFCAGVGAGLLSLTILVVLGGLADPRFIGKSPAADPLAWERVVCWGLPATLLVYGGLHLEPLFRRPWATPLIFLGDASYALYLFHPFVIATILTVLGGVPFVLAASLSIGAAIVMYLGLERPVLRMLRTPAAAVARAA